MQWHCLCEVWEYIGYLWYWGKSCRGSHTEHWLGSTVVVRRWWLLKMLTSKPILYVVSLRMHRNSALLNGAAYSSVTRKHFFSEWVVRQWHSCPGRWWSHCSWRYSRTMCMWHWKMGSVGIVGVGWWLGSMIWEVFFQPWWVYDYGKGKSRIWQSSYLYWYHPAHASQFSCPLGPKLLPEKMRLIMIPLFLPAPCPYSPCTAQHRWEKRVHYNAGVG